MNRIIDKIAIIIFCFTICLINNTTIYIVVPLILIITFSSLLEFFSNNLYIKYILYTIYILLCFIFPILIAYIPVILYDYIFENNIFLLINILPIIYNINKINNIIYIYLLVTILMVILLKLRSIKLTNLKNEFIQLRDKNREYEIYLQDRNKELISHQNYQIYIATLDERNRIARDIHDGVGHILSSSILQLGALIVSTQDKNQKNLLIQIKNTLNTGMDSIRTSIHKLYDESIDLELEINKLLTEFKFCKINFDYYIENLHDNEIKYSIIYIVKEALTNITKHSNATEATIRFREQPSMFQLVIFDNGNKNNTSLSNGIGIKSIEQRVKKLNGNITITKDNGFRIFITIPKEKK